MTADPGPRAARFELAPIVDGNAAWDRALPLVLVPVQLSVPLVVAPPSDVVLVVDVLSGGAR